MKMNSAVAAMLILSLFGSVAPAQQPPPVVKKEPVPAPDKYPLAEAVRALESGDPPRNGTAKHVPTVPALSMPAPPPAASPEVPRSFEANRDVALNATGTEAI